MRSPKLRKCRLDPRQHRCSELGNDPVRLYQMLNGKGWLFLGLVKQSEDHLRSARMMPPRPIEGISFKGYDLTRSAGGSLARAPSIFAISAASWSFAAIARARCRQPSASAYRFYQVEDTKIGFGSRPPMAGLGEHDVVACGEHQRQGLVPSRQLSDDQKRRFFQ